jgi:DNA primase
VIPDVELARVRESADLVAIAGEHTPLKRVGRQWMAQCPFHDERTASLSINGEDGVWWCFGCQQGGDTIDFVQRIHHLDFIEAVEWLAARSGITLSRQPGQPTTDTKTRLVAITNEAATWYHRRLLDSDEARPALDYLTARGVTRALLEEFQVGWAPAGWDELVRSLEIPGEVAIAAGVAKTNRAGRLQDMFRSRITFPIRDVAGNVIGFGARRLPDGAGPKYLNSPDTSLYHKSRALYGLHRAKGHIVNTGASVVCEGYLDVLGAAAAGITNAVASCGTALGSEHLRLLARFADRVVLAFDADTAGATAAARLHDLEARHNLTLFVAALPPGTDPGDLGFTAPNQLRQAIDDAVPLMTFLVDRALVGDDHTIEGRVRTANKALSVVAEHPDPLVRDQYLMVVADRLHLDSALLRDRLTEIALSRSSTVAPTPPVEAPSPIPSIEMNAIRLAAATDDRTQLWWLDPALFADPGAQRASAALRDTATVAEALEILDGAGRPVLLMAAADRQHLDDGEEVAARLVEAAVQRHIAGLDASTSDGIDRITRLRQQLQLLRPAATRAAATRAAYDLLRSA